MAAPRGADRHQTDAPAVRRFTVDASVFVNAFNLHEAGHARSLAFLTAIHEKADPIIIPTLLLVEVASAVARASGDTEGALAYAHSIESLPHLSLISLTPALARHAADLAATHRLRGADAVYVAVARRYGTVLVSRDREQRTRGAAVAICRTPERALNPPARALQKITRRPRPDATRAAKRGASVSSTRGRERHFR